MYLELFSEWSQPPQPPQPLEDPAERGGGGGGGGGGEQEREREDIHCIVHAEVYCKVLSLSSSPCPFFLSHANVVSSITYM